MSSSTKTGYSTFKRNEAIPLLPLSSSTTAPISITSISNETNKSVSAEAIPSISWEDKSTRVLTYCLIAAFLFISIVGLSVYFADDPLIVETESANDIFMNENEISHESSSENMPHIIWLILDDLGQSDFSWHGSEFETPNIDSIAGNGIELKQHYTNPLCSPSRAAFISGRFAHTMGLQGVLSDVIVPVGIAHLPSRYKTIANHLQSIGYDTRAYGKWHLGYSKQSYTPMGRGFNHHIGYYQYAINEFTKYNLDDYDDGYDWFVDGMVDWSTAHESFYSTQIVVDQIVHDIGRYSSTDGPLFSYIALQNPHFPIVTPSSKDLEDRCAHISNEYRNKYCKSVIFLDNSIGRIIDALNTANMYDNSLIILATDNGAYALNACGNPGNHYSAGSAFPFRAGKYTLFQGGILTPAFISGALINEKYHGRQNFHVFHAVDWFKTILHFANSGIITDDISAEVDSIDMYNILFDEKYLSPSNFVSSFSDLNLDSNAINSRADVELEFQMESHSNFNSDALSMDKKFFMHNRPFLLLSMSENNGELAQAAVIDANGYKLMIHNDFMLMNNYCDVRSPKPGTDDFSSKIVDGESQTDCELILFSLTDDPYEKYDLLEYDGYSSKYFAEYEDIIQNMLTFVQSQFRMYAKQVRKQEWANFTLPDIANGINGAHVPWQMENEREFPEGYYY